MKDEFRSQKAEGRRRKVRKRERKRMIILNF